MKKHCPSTFLFLLSFLVSASGQTPASGDIFTHVSSLISGMPGSSGNQYQTPSAQDVTDWGLMLDDLFAANYAGADTKADALGYELLEYSDTPTGHTFYVLETLGTNHWGTYILNPTACRSELVLMAPHPKKDFRTGKEAIYAFQQLDAFFFMTSGTNRCNQSNFSPCSGTTTVCTGSSEDYRISDMAHVTDAIWQKTTEYVHDNVGGTYFVQLHGFTKGATDPYVIMSNGTRQTPAPDKISDLRAELLLADPVLTFKIAHIDLSWNRLIGFTNTNGRYINSSGDPCGTNAVATNGRFLHVEQEKSRLRNDIIGWNRMAVALGETFNSGGCPSLPLLPVELVFFEAKPEGKTVHLKWQTASEQNTAYFDIEHSTDGTGFEKIGRVEAQGESHQTHDYSFDHMPPSGQNFYRLRQMDLDGETALSPVRSVVLENENPPVHCIFLSHQQWVVDFSEEVSATLLLFDGLGRSLFSEHVASRQIKAPVGHLPTGIYFYQIKLDNGKVLAGKLWNGTD